MHQLLSTIFSFFLSPLHWIIIFVFLSFFIKRITIKKCLRIIALIIFLLFSNATLLNWCAKKWQPSPAELKPGTVYTCGIVLGGFASPDADEHGYFNSSSDRFIQAVRLYKLSNIQHLMVCGGNGKKSKKNFREATWVKEELKIIGIPDSVIFVEDRSNNTADNALYAKQMLDAAKLSPPYLLITSAHHIPRASLLFLQAGVVTESFPCNYIAGRSGNGFTSLLPQLDVLTTWDTYLKEIAGYYWYKWK